MVSLMPAIPLTSTPATPIYDKKRRYTPDELGTFQFDPALLTIAQIRRELKYYKDEKEYVGPRTLPNNTGFTRRQKRRWGATGAKGTSSPGKCCGN